MIVVDSKGGLYIQQRSRNKAAFPLFWDISAAEHLKSGEGYEEAAVRGLAEELSILAPVKRLRGKHIQKSEYIKSGEVIKEYELVELYGTVYDGKIKVDRQEVAQVKTLSLDRLKKLIQKERSNFTPWGLEELGYIIEHPAILWQLQSLV